MIKPPASELLYILFPKVRAEILRLLFFEPAQQRYVRELVVMSGLALRTIQEELANLSAAGLVTSWSNGYHRFYRANRRHPLFSELRRIVRMSARLPAVKKPPPRRKPAPVSKKAWLTTRRIRSLQTPLV
jgi:predicted transcriptional regulator